MSESEKRTEDWVSIQTPDGQNRIASPSYIRNLLGIEKLEEKLENLWNWCAKGENRPRLDQIISELARDIYTPKMQQAIALLLLDRDLTEAEIKQKLLPKPQEATLDWHGFWRAWESYVEAGVIGPISRGRGKPRLWHLSSRPESEEERQERINGERAMHKMGQDEAPLEYTAKTATATEAKQL